MTLKQMREGRGITQDELAAVTGVTKAAISRIELGYVANPLYSTMVRLAAGLATSPEALHLAVTESIRARENGAAA